MIKADMGARGDASKMPRPSSRSAIPAFIVMDVMQAAAERAPFELEESMEHLVRSVETGRCPADDFSDRVVRNGIATAVTELAQGQL